MTPTGQIAVQSHLTIRCEKTSGSRDFHRIVRCFMPNPNKHDGSYDLVLGSDSENGGQPFVRIIDDFIPAYSE